MASFVAVYDACVLYPAPLRDLRAKAMTDKAESKSLEAAQRQLGHASITTTEIYIRNRRGKQSDPTK